MIPKDIHTVIIVRSLSNVASRRFLPKAWSDFQEADKTRIADSLACTIFKHKSEHCDDHSDIWRNLTAEGARAVQDFRRSDTDCGYIHVPRDVIPGGLGRVQIDGRPFCQSKEISGEPVSVPAVRDDIDAN